MKKQWYRVEFEGCFQDDMVGYVIEMHDKAITLKFSSTEQVTFYKEQLKYEGEF